MGLSVSERLGFYLYCVERWIVDHVIAHWNKERRWGAWSPRGCFMSLSGFAYAASSPDVAENMIGDRGEVRRIPPGVPTRPIAEAVNGRGPQWHDVYALPGKSCFDRKVRPTGMVSDHQCR